MYICSFFKLDIRPCSSAGAGLYVEDSLYLNNEPVANNTIVVISDSTYEKVDVYCYSNSTSSNVGYFVLSNNYITTSSYNRRSIRSHNTNANFAISRSIPSGIRIHTYSSYRPRSYGIFTCVLPDSEGNTIDTSIGIYSSTPSMFPHNICYRFFTNLIVIILRCTRFI